jgi:hypothetical protein
MNLRFANRAKGFIDVSNIKQTSPSLFFIQQVFFEYYLTV